MNYQINSEKILFTQVGDEGVVYEVQNNGYTTLSETMFKILKGVENGQSPSEITIDLCNEYKIDEITCGQEVVKALKELKEKEYIFEKTNE